MNIITVLYLFTCFVTLFFGSYVLRLNPRNNLNKVFLSHCLGLSLWGFTYAFMQSAPDKEIALFWRKISVFGWCFIYGTMLHFFLLLTKQKKILKKWWIYPLIYTPGFILMGLFLIPPEGVSRDYLFLTEMGWTYLLSPDDPVRFWGFSVYYLSYSIISIILLLQWREKTEFKREKKQADIILTVLLIAIIIGSIPDVLLPALDIIILPPLGIVVNLLVMAAVWYGIKEYRFIALTTEKFTEDILETMNEGLLLLDLEGKIKMMNRMTKKLLGYSREELINQPVNDVFADENVFSLSEFEDNELNNEEKKLFSKKGREVPVFFSASLMYDDWGDAMGVVCTFQDITERKQAEKRLKFLTYYDQMTELYNRNYLEKKIEEVDKKENCPLTIILADLNGLKLINDGFGHQVGDEILKRAAEILKQSCRKKDIVGRWGGDEFVIIAPQTTKDQAEGVCKKINKACKETPEDPVAVSIALGTAEKNNVEEDIYEVLKEAEDVMYKHKLLESRSAQNTALDTLIKTLGAKSHETEKHVRRLQNMAFILGREIGLSSPALDNLSLLASLHDVGKVTIPEEILTKPASLTEEEWNVIKKHPEKGYRIASSTEEFAHVAEEILYHHEHWDGSGYPEGICGKEIPILARIIAIVDAYDAMTNERVYSSSMSKEEAVIELKRCAGTQFDPDLVKTFIQLIESGKIK